MASKEDLDWLYGPGRRPEPPQRPAATRVMPAQPTPGAASAMISPPVKKAGVPTSSAPNERAFEPPGDPGSPKEPPAAPAAPEPAPKRRKRRHPVRWAVAIVVLVLLGILGWYIYVPMHAFSTMSRIDNSYSAPRPSDQPGTVYLLVGSDSREGLTKEERKKLGTGHNVGNRTDTMMLLYNPPSGKPALISLPRDSYLAIPGHGQNKLNAAYHFGGAALLTRTIEQATGLRIDHYVQIGFGGFANMVDAVGGVDVCLKKPMKDADAHIDLPKGCQTLDGVQALGYVRMRKSDPLGDLGRVQRQRQIVGAIMKKTMSADTLLNPTRYWNVTHAGFASVAADKKTELLDMPGLAFSMQKLGSGDALTLTVPVSDSNAQTPHGSAVLWDSNAAAKMFGLIAQGKTEGLEAYAKKK